jgi:putative PIN family toxin of toxin-antitoxin system
LTTRGGIRAVFDTNVYVAAVLSRNPRSPTLELFERLKRDEFTLLYCAEIHSEVIEKLLDKGIDSTKITEFIAGVTAVAERVDIGESDTIPLIPADPEDDVIVACAVKGGATHLVTYDPDFAVLAGEYQGIKVIDGLHFLYAIRGK